MIPISMLVDIMVDGMVVDGTIRLGSTGAADQAIMVPGDRVLGAVVLQRVVAMGLPKTICVLAGATHRTIRARAQVHWQGAEPVVE